MQLALAIDDSEDISRIGGILRDVGGISALVPLLSHPVPEVNPYRDTRSRTLLSHPVPAVR